MEARKGGPLVTVAYLSSFDLRLITWGITLTPAGAGTPATINSDSFAKPCHIHGPAGVGAYDLASNPTAQIEDEPDNDAKFSELAFGTNCAFYLNTLTAAWGTPTTITFAFDLATLRYTIARSSGDSFAISFTGVGAALFGFSGSSSSATTHTGTRTPLYALAASSSGLSANSGDQEQGGRSAIVVSDSCATFSSRRRTASKVVHRWEQRFEPAAKTWTEFATSTDPWTYQALIRNALLGLPFAVRDSQSSRQGLYLIDNGADAFEPIPASESNHAQLHIPFRCWKWGTRAV